MNRAIDWTRARRLRAEAELGESVGRSGAGRRRSTGRCWPRSPSSAPEQRAVDRPPAPARLHAGRDRGAALAPARHGELAPAPRARHTAGEGVRRELESIEIPGEHEARERAWEVVSAAFARARADAAPALVEARSPLSSRSRSWSPGCSAHPDAPCSTSSARPSAWSRPNRRSSRCLRPGACSCSRTPEPGSSSRTARSGGSAPIGRRRGLRSAASWSPRAATSSSR